MKNTYFFVMLFSFYFCNAQVNETNVDNGSDYYFNLFIDQPATFPNGQAAFEKYFKDSFVVNENIPTYRDPIKIFMEFIVEKDGSLTTLRISKGFGYNSVKEGLRVLSKSPKWIPGKDGGKAVRAKCEFYCEI